MTQQYLAGELSVLLAQLRAVSGAAVGEVHALRLEAENSPPVALGSVARRAIRLSDALCWDSVARGDVASFDRQAATAAELFQFSVCAGLLGEACWR